MSQCVWLLMCRFSFEHVPLSVNGYWLVILQGLKQGKTGQEHECTGVDIEVMVSSAQQTKWQIMIGIRESIHLVMSQVHPIFSSSIFESFPHCRTWGSFTWLTFISYHPMWHLIWIQLIFMIFVPCICNLSFVGSMLIIEVPTLLFSHLK